MLLSIHANLNNLDSIHDLSELLERTSADIIQAVRAHRFEGRKFMFTKSYKAVGFWAIDFNNWLIGQEDN